MRAAARKKAPPVVIAGGRDELSRAIELAAEAERRLQAKRDAVSRSVAAIETAEQRLEAAQAGIQKAKEHDVRRATAGITARRESPATSSMTQKALTEITEAEASLEVSIEARKKLEHALAEAEDDAAERSNDISVAIKAITASTIERLIEEVSSSKKRLAVAKSILSFLVASEDGPRFHDQWRARAAENRRDDVLAELKTKADDLVEVADNEAEHDDAVQAAVVLWSDVLAELRLNPAAKLPSED